MEGLNDLERAVLDKLLWGDHPTLLALRAQAEKVHLKSREYTGVGFYCNLDMRAEKSTLQGDFIVSGVHGELENLKYGACFVLFVTDGRLDCLEGATYDDPWSQEVGNFELVYVDEPRDLSLDVVERR